MITTKSRPVLLLLIFLTALVMSSCTQSPDDVREWMLDKRRPAKMREFILNERNTLDTKVECLMVLIERNDCTKLPATLDKPLTADEINQIVAGAIPRMKLLFDNPDATYYATYVKDASYYLLKLKNILNEDNKAALIGFIRTWLDGPNFFLPLEKAGRVEQGRLYEEIGNQDSVAIFQHALTTQLDNLEAAFQKEEAEISAAQADGKKFKVRNRPSDKIANNIATNLNNLDAMKLPGANDMVAQIVTERINKNYPNLPKVLAFPFARNDSPILLEPAKKLLMDPEYKNLTINYYKDVMINTYYKKNQKDAGVEVCSELIKTDATGYSRWDCLEIVTAAKGREGFADVINSLPDDPALIPTPEDHPTLIENPALTTWNSMRVYCSHLNTIFNNQVPLDVFRQFIKAYPPVLKPTHVKQDGTEKPDTKVIQRILSMACLVTLGTESDIELLATLNSDKTDITAYKVQVSTLGDLANYTSTLLDKRIENQKKAAANPSEQTPAPVQPAPEVVPAAPTQAPIQPAAKPVEPAATPRHAPKPAEPPKPAPKPAPAATPKPAPKPAPMNFRVD